MIIDKTIKKVIKEVAEENNISVGLCEIVFITFTRFVKEKMENDVFSIIKVPYFGSFFATEKKLDRYVAKHRELSSEGDSEDESEQSPV